MLYCELWICNGKYTGFCLSAALNRFVGLLIGNVILMHCWWVFEVTVIYLKLELCTNLITFFMNGVLVSAIAASVYHFIQDGSVH